MLGICYLLMAGLAGYEITEGLLWTGSRKETAGINRIWLKLPASFGVGTLLLTWLVYAVSWFAGAEAGAEKPLFYGNLVGFLLAGSWLALLYFRRYRRLRIGSRGPWISDKARFKRELVCFILLFLGILAMMYYVFFVRDGILCSGFTVYGDYAPHTAMMRSFSMGNNFPTQYPHFGGEDVKYHFMFQFLAGNLEYLGLRIDFAYNIISALSLTGFLMLLYLVALRITGKMSCGIVTLFFFFFRSGAAFFRFAWEHLQAGDLWKTLTSNTSFIGYTEHEDWGLWNFNVYLNQRHLAFGLLLAAIGVFLYMDWLEAGLAHEEKGLAWLRGRLFSREAWKSRSLDTALLLGVILGLGAFWNGAALIGGLLFLLGFAVFSDGKLDYAVTAGTAVFFSVLQTKIFIRGQAMSPAFQFGFLAEEKTLWGAAKYLFWMGGIFFIGLAVLALFMKRRERVYLLSFLLPTVFAFTFSLTPDINVNHKYVMISYAFLAIFWAWAVCGLFRRGIPGKLAAALLALCLTVTGIYDFAVILIANGPGRKVGVRLDSDVTEWISRELHRDDLLLTPEYSMNEVTMSGEMLYCGWPYYAWSAGYDTNYRAARAVEIYTTTDRELLKKTVEQEKITYILYQDNMEFEQRACREDVIADTFRKVYTSEDGRMRIYETR